MKKNPKAPFFMLPTALMTLLLGACDLFQTSLAEYLKNDQDGGTGAGEEESVPYVYAAVDSGNDGNSGRSRTSPVKTLGRALDIWAAEGSAEARIMLLENVTHPGYSDAEAVTVDGFIDFSSLLSSGSRNGITTVTLAGDGTGKIIDNGGATGRRVLYINTAGKVINLKNLTVTGGRGDHGAGVHIGGGGALSIAGGVVITGNEANNDGGGVYVDGVGSNFTMTGGEIHHNKALSNSSGKGGGVCVGDNGTFTMEGGTIRDNTSGNDGGGVYVSGVNSAALVRQGAIGVSGGGNTAKYGGGVYAGPLSRLELGLADGSGGPGIQHNTAREGTIGTGGGVVINGNNAQAFFHQGTVSQNRTYSLGGGILVVNGTLRMRGGTVTGNQVDAGNGKGPGIAVEDNGSFFMSGAARMMSPDNPVYLDGTSRYITIGAGGFTGGLSTGIALVKTNGYSPGHVILRQEESGNHHITACYDYFDVDGKGLGSSLNPDGTLK
ncbi:MAG: hypothetical protein LBQ55_07240 [Treponema sp.]|nr:hypothetical protein [Treponema sp.]